MDNQLNEKPKDLECQFYIVLGNCDEEFHNDTYHRYFKVRGNEDINLIQYAFIEEWKKKKKEHIKVASEIIFLVPEERYRDVALKLMKILNVRGKVEVVQAKTIEKEEIIDKENVIEKEEALVSDENNISEVDDTISSSSYEVHDNDVFSMDDDVTDKKVDDVSSLDSGEITLSRSDRHHKSLEEEVNDGKKDKLEDSLDFEVERVVVSKDNSNVESSSNFKDSSDHVFHGDFNKKASFYNGVDDEIWGNEKKLMKRKKKKGNDGKVSFAVIIFILSFLLLLGAIILLFVLK